MFLYTLAHPLGTYNLDVFAKLSSLTLGGIEALQYIGDKSLQPSKALFPIEMTPEGISNFPLKPLQP